MTYEEAKYKTIQTEQDGDVFILTLYRPEKRNALNQQLRIEVVDALMSVRANPEVRAIIIWGGQHVFSAGADLSEMVSPRPLQFFRPFNTAQPSSNMWETVASMLQPTIAAVSGGAFGGGCELSLACDFRIASETALFGQTEINVGLIPGAGGTQRLSRLVGMTKAKEMVLLGEVAKAEEAYRIGLVNKVVPVEQLLDEAKIWARKLAEKSPIALQMAKLMMDKGYDLALDAAMTMESLSFAHLFGTTDQKEGVKAFLEKRKPVFKGE